MTTKSKGFYERLGFCRVESQYLMLKAGEPSELDGCRCNADSQGEAR
jgi:hypothetical protein